MASCFEKQHTDLEDGPVYSRAILFRTEINEEPQRRPIYLFLRDFA